MMLRVKPTVLMLAAALIAAWARPARAQDPIQGIDNIVAQTQQQTEAA